LEAARRAYQLIKEMVPLLPFSYSSAVQRVLELPLVDVSLDTKGHFVYCLLSPYLGWVLLV
jgi:hypothetical protein